MKILITSDLYDPSVSGVVTSLKILYNGLKRKGHEVKILTLSNTFKEKKRDEVYYVGSFSASAIYPDTRIAYPQKSRVIKELIEWNPDVIHTHCELSTFACACYISRKTITPTPIVHTYHTYYEYYMRYLPLGVIMLKRFLPGASRRVSQKTKALIVPSEKTRLLLNEYGITNGIVIIPTSVNDIFLTEDYGGYRNEIRQIYGITEEEIVFLYFGRIAKEKNIEELIDYAASEEMKNFRIVIAGDGPYMKKIKTYAKRKNILDNIIFTGMVQQEDAPKYYVAADIFINASSSETQGLTYLEAMSCSLPILCRFDNCLDGVVENGENGFVYKNREEFLSYADMLSKDSKQRSRIGKNARKTVYERYTSEMYVNSCEKLYCSVVQ